MTTLQAGSWAQAARRVTRICDCSGLRAFSRTAIGIAILVALLVAAVAVRVLVYVRF